MSRNNNSFVEPFIIISMISMLLIIAALTAIIVLQSKELERRPVAYQKTEIIKQPMAYQKIPISMTMGTYLIRCQWNVASFGVIQATQEASGSGWGVNLSEYGMPERRYLVTAAHVILRDLRAGVPPRPVDSVEIQIRTDKFKKWVKCKILVARPDIDTAILEAEEDLPVTFNLASDGTVGSSIIISGCPGGTAPSSQIGTLTSKDPGLDMGLKCPTWQAFATFYHGNSGGPIIDAESQKVIGMLVAGWRTRIDSDTMIPGVALCIPCYVIRGLLDQTFQLAGEPVPEDEKKQEQKKQEAKPAEPKLPEVKLPEAKPEQKPTEKKAEVVPIPIHP